MSKPLRISWSSLRTWEDCHQRSYLLREGNRAKVSNIRNFVHGSIVDAIMRIWLDDPLHPPGRMVVLVEEMVQDTVAKEKAKGNVVLWRNAADRDEMTTFCRDLVTRLEPILQKHVLPYPYEHGKWFKVPMEIWDQQGNPREVLLTGEMDLLVNNDGPVVWDLKGTADDQYWRKVVAQLTFYDIAIWASSRRKTRHVGLIQPMCREQVLAFEVTDAARRDLLTRIERYARSVWADERECTTDTSKCHWCDVKHACSRFESNSMDPFGELAVNLRTAATEDIA